MTYCTINLPSAGDRESKRKNKRGYHIQKMEKRKDSWQLRKISDNTAWAAESSPFLLWLFIQISPLIQFFFFPPLSYFKLGLNSNYIDLTKLSASVLWWFFRDLP